MMNLVNFVVWLSAGAVIGWFASWMVKVEQRLRPEKPEIRHEHQAKKD